MRKKALFIDRDGTINWEKNYVHRVEDFEFLPGALEALRLLTNHGIAIYIITNQAGIAKGYFTEEHYRVLTDHMLRTCEDKGIAINKVLFCPHHPEGTVPEYAIPCLCRKPNTLLIEKEIAENGYRIDELALIGDKKSDIEAGARLCIDTYLVLTGYGKEHSISAAPTYVMTDILDAVRHIISVH